MNAMNAMNQVTIRNLDDPIVKRLKQLAWQDGRSWEEMAKLLLIEAVELRGSRHSRGELTAAN